ncbi:MAG: beta-N-acetylglucosaminidase domain-containing protein, partial [Succinivibrio sp.]
MNTSIGIIEGFYGTPYSQADRKDLFSFVSSCGYNYYIYAPKNDRSLRREWKTPFSDHEISFLKEMKCSCQQNGLEFGIGISPIDITQNMCSDLEILIDKIKVCTNEIGASIIAVLFDDIRLYTSYEGDNQKHIINTVCEHLSGNNIRVVFCPTYYSFDPILNKCFGDRPDSYFGDITDGLLPNIEVFWTGNKVLSKSITPEDVSRISSLLGRKVTIWDNYPVNDGKFICKHIYTKAFSQRNGLDSHILSHAVNPMLECHLGKVALCTLPAVYRGASAEEIELKRMSVLEDIFLDKTQLILPYLDILNDEGLKEGDTLTAQRIRNIIGRPDTKGQKELLDFLDGRYA